MNERNRDLLILAVRHYESMAITIGSSGLLQIFHHDELRHNLKLADQVEAMVVLTAILGRDISRKTSQEAKQSIKETNEWLRSVDSRGEKLELGQERLLDAFTAAGLSSLME